MLDFSYEFGSFNSAIKLTESRKEKILKSRNAVREKIRSHFKNDLKLNQPIFKIQGSFAIFTALNPLNDNEVDIDDGVYFQHLDEDESKWPAPKDAHKLILDSLEGHTQDGCESKTSCVRVLYRNDYHLDLPIYIIKNNKAYLAQKKLNKWINSDSKEFRDWYYRNRNGEQTSRITRYLKAWRDYLELDIPSIELTILAVNCFQIEEERDDLSLYNTVRAISNNLKLYRKVQKPVSPFENLWEELSETDKDKRIKQFADLENDISTALNNTSNSRASLIFIELFGDRFPKKEDSIKSVYTQINTGAKPWGR